ncbi:RecT family recombinase [Paenibacillus larvae]|nr:RecT family recombinase [Paenibacillus larvae]YP_009197988.1 RecT-like ssDNA annealing protein [Paenibacillus phage Diva]YP_009598572.1 RecT-like ssDNA annealing protein [Paenibacillus phage Shelly]QVV19595.1 recombinase [Paenibacillus phage Fitz]QVV19663.1 recombinase [Paenibacillus phage Gohan]QVV19728.1 recombinase [Paenibacillus phage Hobie]QVV19978.1 recombinase [Paenibacillus phage Newport]UYL93468.1 recombinase [Paenibacillus phage vB_PlaS-1/A]UYL93540.1 recombinase [Paenibacillus
MAHTQLQAIGNFSAEDLKTIKETIARGATDPQFNLFVRTAAAAGLNPFLNQIYCIVYNGKNGPQMSIQISVEGIVSLGKKHPEYKGFIAAEVKENDEFKANYQKGEVEHEITTMQRGQTVGAYCIAYREGAPNVLVIVTKDQVEHHLKGRNPDMWRDYFDDMITKHAIKRAFKRQYGVEISEDNHTAQNSVENIPAYEPTRKDITQEVDVTATSPEPKIEHPKQQTTAETDDEKLRQLKAEMKEKFKKLGITGKEEMEAYLSEHFKMKGDKPTFQEMTGLLKIMDLHIQEKQSNDDELPI